MGGRRGGKASRAKSKLRRKKIRRGRKDAQQAQYIRWRDQGINQKSKRFVKGRRKGPRTHKHAVVNCGNVGCVRCAGLNFDPFLTGALKMPHWMWLKYQKYQTSLREGLEALAGAKL